MDIDAWYERDPFTDRYWHEELQFHGQPEYERGGLRLTTRPMPPLARLDDYLNVNMRTDLPPIPTLYIDDTLWMSVTPMEIQSHHLPIQFAQTIAATAGLGLGHFALRTVGMPHVEELHVFEQDQRVIDCFLAVHGKRPGVEKIRFHVGDARTTLFDTDIRFDTLYVDIYETVCPDEAIDDLRRFRDLLDDPNGYSWWGEELVLLNALHYGLIGGMDIPLLTARYLSMWQESRLGELRHRQIDQQYCEDVIGLLHISIRCNQNTSAERTWQKGQAMKIVRRQDLGDGRERPVIACSCGREVLCMGFTNTCECGADYNMSGQQLAPRDQWGEETGESVADILRADTDPFEDY